MRAWRRFRFWLRCRRCWCGQYRLSPGDVMELNGFRHQRVGRCFPVAAEKRLFERLVARLEKENAELRGASSDHTRSCPCFEDQRFDDPSQEERP